MPGCARSKLVFTVRQLAPSRLSVRACKSQSTAVSGGLRRTTGLAWRRSSQRRAASSATNRSVIFAFGPVVRRCRGGCQSSLVAD
eukprot:6208236-Pleurochrysis_carterae.AAC.3